MLGEGNRNLLLIGAMELSPIFFLLKPVFIPKVDLPLISLCLFLILLPLSLHPETMRWSTVLYSCLFCSYFMVFVRVLKTSTYSDENFLTLLKGLLYAYCIVLIIQQFCVLVNLPIFNVSNYTPLNPWKLNSLMSEPSHSARIIPILMYFFLLTKERIIGKKYVFKEQFAKDKKVWFAFLWPVLTMGSATAFIFLLIILLKLFSNLTYTKGLFMAAIVLAVVLAFGQENKNVKRSIDFTTAVVTLDEKNVIEADGSGAHRIVSTLRGAKFIGLTKVDDLFGYGVDADMKLVPNFQSVVLPGSAGAFHLWVNFGLFVAILWWGFSFRLIYQPKAKCVSIFIWFITIFIMGGLNNQIIWMVLAISYGYKELGVRLIRRRCEVL